jgi:hypothetical protein
LQNRPGAIDGEVRTAGVSPALTTASITNGSDQRRSEMKRKADELRFLDPPVTSVNYAIVFVRAGGTPAVRFYREITALGF